MRSTRAEHTRRTELRHAAEAGSFVARPRSRCLPNLAEGVVYDRPEEEACAELRAAHETELECAWEAPAARTSSWLGSLERLEREIDGLFGTLRSGLAASVCQP